MSKVSVKRHLRELQWRFLLVAVFFIVGAALAYQFQGWLIPALLNPLGGQKLVYLNPAGGFSFIFLISIYVGLAFAIPILIQQLYAFLRPALPERARRKSPVIIIGSFLLLIAGVAFGYFVAVPNALQFLYSFADQYVEASLTAESYLNFVIAYTIGIGLVFQLPLLLLLINTIKPLTPGGLLKSEKWVVLIAFIIAAIITPTPDPINQAIIAGPVVVVYQIGVVMVLVSIANTRAKRQKALRLERKANRQAAKLGDIIEEIEDIKEPEKPFTVPTPTFTKQLEQTAAIPKPQPIAKPQQRFVDIKPMTKPQTLASQLAVHADIKQVAPVKPGLAMDGFVRRPAHLQVPQRQGVPAPHPVPRPQQNRPVPTGRRTFIDGIQAPQRAAFIS